MGGVGVLLIILLFVFFFVSLMAVAEGQGKERKKRAVKRERAKPSTEVTAAARAAMHRAGYEQNSQYVQVADIGLLAYRSADDPKLVRYGDVLADTHYLRPFAELWLPHDARGSVRFELLDDQERLRYADEKQYALSRGINTLLPGTWLPLQGKSVPSGDWNLRVMAGNTLLAMHRFGWQPVGGGEIQRFVKSDGEISPALQDLLRAKSREAVSLSDLLADQED